MIGFGMGRPGYYGLGLYAEMAVCDLNPMMISAEQGSGDFVEGSVYALVYRLNFFF